MSLMHEARVRGASQSLEAASHALLGFLNAMPQDAAMEPLVGGWTPAAHVWHVGLVNDVFRAILRGEAPLVVEPGVPDISDDRWNFSVPPPIAAPDFMMPPLDVPPGAAATLVRESVARLRPEIESLDPARASLTVQIPWARVSVYQLVEWAGGHTLRHLAQVGRELHQSALRTPVVA
jgi:hypothetical protein